jgi:hypothetical protein
LLDSRHWTPLLQAFAEALEWMLDRARDFAHDYPEEVAAVERVREFARRRIVGGPADGDPRTTRLHKPSGESTPDRPGDRDFYKPTFA